MAVDPTDPETNGSGTNEVPEADAAEQEADLRPEDDGPPPRIDHDAANEADAVEQARVVALDEDDYR
ncbi:hypothetical protein ACH4E8_02620 [Streptomyces sp. NPDC017979]|uniref:hypothetical protein n=1 Tax=unclassified Streptomyces TaxID=2593676 RepID=UPI00378B5C07